MVKSQKKKLCHGLSGWRERIPFNVFFLEWKNLNSKLNEIEPKCLAMWWCISLALVTNKYNLRQAIWSPCQGQFIALFLSRSSFILAPLTEKEFFSLYFSSSRRGSSNSEWLLIRTEWMKINKETKCVSFIGSKGQRRWHTRNGAFWSISQCTSLHFTGTDGQTDTLLKSSSSKVASMTDRHTAL